MVKNSKVSLNASEKSIIKALLNEGWRSQDVQALINSGRSANINFGRIAYIKKSQNINPASKQQVDEFKLKKKMFDHVTGLCPFNDERLVRAREAMILAVGLFNTPRIAFKAGAFSMLANVAWTYLMHEYYSRRNLDLIRPDGYTMSLSQLIERSDCPLSKACKQNLAALKEIRDVVEHKSIGFFDKKWLPLFQSTCLNFEKSITTFLASNCL